MLDRGFFFRKVIQACFALVFVVSGSVSVYGMHGSAGRINDSIRQIAGYLGSGGTKSRKAISSAWPSLMAIPGADGHSSVAGLRERVESMYPGLLASVDTAHATAEAAKVAAAAAADAERISAAAAAAALAANAAALAANAERLRAEAAAAAAAALERETAAAEAAAAAALAADVDGADEGGDVGAVTTPASRSATGSASTGAVAFSAAAAASAAAAPLVPTTTVDVAHAAAADVAKAAAAAEAADRERAARERAAAVVAEAAAREAAAERAAHAADVGAAGGGGGGEARVEAHGDVGGAAAAAAGAAADRPLFTCGLVNPGSRCFVTAALQCLRAWPWFYRTLMANADAIKSTSEDVVVSCSGREMRFRNGYGELCDLFTAMLAAEGRGDRYVDTHAFLTPMMRLLFNEDVNGAMQDAQELVNFMLNDIRTQFPDIGSLFAVQMRQIVSCPEGHESISDQPKINYIGVGVPLVKGAHTVQTCLNQLMEPEEIGDYRCDHCPAPVNAQMNVMLANQPQMLMVQLMRFREVERGIWSKNNTSVRVTDGITISVGGEDVYYSLCAAALHSGETLNEGHYTALVRKPNGGWAFCNDETVEDGGRVFVALERDGNLGGMTASLLFYERIDGEAGAAAAD